AFLGTAVPPFFVLIGVLCGILHSPVGDVWIWTAGWLGIGVLATVAPPRDPSPTRGTSRRLRVVHGLTATLILIYVAFHLFNHLAGQMGPDVHAEIMKVGRRVYRSAIGEPFLITMMLFQVVTGVRLFWTKSAQPLGLEATIQLASGVYLAAFIV